MSLQKLNVKRYFLHHRNQLKVNQLIIVGIVIATTKSNMNDAD